MMPAVQSTDLVKNEFIDFISKILNTSEFKVLPIAGDASTRRYFRIILKNEETFVLMAWDPFDQIKDYPFLSVQNHFLKSKVHVPEVINISPIEGLVLLEDLGDLTLERKFWENNDQSSVKPYYEMAIDELIKIHYKTKDSQVDSTALHNEFSFDKLMWELNYGYENLFIKLLNLNFSNTEEIVIKNTFNKLCDHLSKEPKVICHRDYHSRNVMIKHGKIFVIDFQDARLGPIQYDLVSLFKDSYVEISDEFEGELVQYYIKEAKKNNPFLKSDDNFWNTYQYQILQRCFKACGSFASFRVMREDKRYLKYIGHTLKTVFKTAKENKDFNEFSNIIEHKGCLDIDYNKL